jgi:hypothetical protein
MINMYLQCVRKNPFNYTRQKSPWLSLRKNPVSTRTLCPLQIGPEVSWPKTFSRINSHVKVTCGTGMSQLRTLFLIQLLQFHAGVTFIIIIYINWLRSVCDIVTYWTTGRILSIQTFLENLWLTFDGRLPSFHYFSKKCFSTKNWSYISSDLPLPDTMGITRNVLAFLDLWWWQHMIMRDFEDHCIAVEFIGSRHSNLMPRIQLCPSVPTTPFNVCRRRFLIKIAFAMAINKE